MFVCLRCSLLYAGDHNLGDLNGTTYNQHESYDLDVGNLREALANPYSDEEAAAAFRNNPTRLNAAASTSIAYSDIGWRETPREADHADFDAATALRNNPTRLNAATSSLLYSDLGWRETLKEADTDFGAAATQNTLARLYNLYAGFRGLQIRERETVNREGRIFQLMNAVDMHPIFNKLIESADVSGLKRIVGMIVSQPESLIKASLNPHG